MKIKERKELQVVILTAIITVSVVVLSFKLPPTINLSGQYINLEIIWIGLSGFNIVSIIALFLLLYSTKTEYLYKNPRVEKTYNKLFNLSFVIIGFTIFFFLFINLHMFANRIFNPANNTFLGLVIMGIIAYGLIRLYDHIKDIFR